MALRGELCILLSVALALATSSVAQADKPTAKTETDSSNGAILSDPNAFEPYDPAPIRFPPTWKLGDSLTMRFRGRIDADAIGVSQSPANQAFFGELSNVVGLRRARVGLEGNLGRRGRYVLEVDLASGEVAPRDVYFGQDAQALAGELQLGHFREPFSLEGGTSAKYFAFMERSPINLLDPGRNWGLGWFHDDLAPNRTLSIGVFHAGTDIGGLQGGDGSTVGLTGRATAAPVDFGNGERLLHFGLALSARVPESGIISINQQPRSPLLELGDSSTTPFVPQLDIPAVYQQLVNAQLATANGALWTQAEWYGTYIGQSDGGPVFLHGFHADCGYFLTGEHREYDRLTGVLGAVRVNRPLWRGPHSQQRPRGLGAWELAARITFLDFSDSDLPIGPTGQTSGIRLSQPTIGVNWYLCDQQRLMFNYSYAYPDLPGAGTSSASIFAMRLGSFW